MSHRVKPHTNVEIASCEKYLSKMLKHDSALASKKNPASRPYQDKISQIMRHPINMQPQRIKPKPSAKTQSPIQKVAVSLMSTMPREIGDGSRIKEMKSTKRKPRSRSRSRSSSKVREAWGHILLSKKSGEKMSTFSNFDPLRTLHFLSKELSTKLRTVVPEEDEILQIVTDIQHALKRIPPEVTTLLHDPPPEIEEPVVEELVPSKTTSTKICQTPPTLYQEDTERFQKIMEENTYRLETSCRQLEMVCSNLQNEKEMTEKELDEAKENVEMLCKKVKELEEEIEEITSQKIRELEEEKYELQQQLEKATQEVTNNPTLNHFKKLVEELKKQKLAADETCNRLEYDMTVLKMEKEKFATMLNVRDKEVKEIQEEMCKIQEQVHKQLKKLNSEVIERVNSVKALSDPTNGMHESLFLEIGDTTISSITANESDKDTINIIKELPCGDTELIGLTKESHENFLQKLKGTNVGPDLQRNNKEIDSTYESLVAGLSPSMQAFLAAHKA
ncbi:hypothetical protein Zmor_007303 [Zophobas morio]|uniref:Uncharacterized protein n=1 Tax=Zophobas morio TaxID=2755281 RepID=A0AA38MM07_9CUCU|nr:hypothetical protein Zmor_007303 [Zophobas morio]